MSEDVGITCSCEGVEDTSVVQINDTVTGHSTQETTTIHKLAFSDVLRHTGFPRYACYCTVQIYIGAVSCVVGVLYLSCFLIICSMTDATFLAASEYLEHIATIQIDGG